MGGAVGRAFAREGARVFLAGGTLAKLDKVAGEIRANGGAAETAQVDAMDQFAVESHADQVAAVAGSIDISFNAISINVVQDIPLVEMSLEDFMAPITDACRTHSVTATTAARHMIAQCSGVIVPLSSTAAQESRHQMGGFNLACARIEALKRSLAGEVGRQGVRVVSSGRTSPPRPLPVSPMRTFRPW
jgi:3-oxoacyl-[acyl-carrier protein] reductase